VQITAKGHELIQLSIPVVRDIENAWEAHLGRTRTRQLRDSLKALREITDPFTQ
jgi:DNA-binding MarR family transcriptional regulator